MNSNLITKENKKLLLTDRWFPLPPQVISHAEQTRLKNNNKQFRVVSAGRRSYKTERFLKRLFVMNALMNKGKKYFLGAPTRPQAKQIFWDDVKELVPDYLLLDINETELRIDFLGGSKLYVVGLKEYDRVHGIRWDGCGITEYQDVDSKIFATTIQPLINDTKGFAILEGRPYGKNHFYDDFIREKTAPERWASFSWKSEGILSDEQILAAKEDLGMIDYKREYEASFEANSDRVYYAFDAEKNISNYDLNYDLPIIISCDFNAGEKPMSWNLGQQIGDNTFWSHSLSYQYTNTLTMCNVVWDVFQSEKKTPKLVRLYGDYSGVKGTSNSSFSDWEIIEKYFNEKLISVEKRIKPCLSIRDRNASTNARLCNANNIRRMFAHPTRCKALVRDWEYVQRAKNGIDLDESNPSLTHASDAVDYFSDYEYPIKGKAQSRFL